MKVARSERYAGRGLLTALVAITILPFLSILTAALYPSGSVPVGLSWPANPQWGNFVEAFKVGPVHSATAVPTKLQGQPGIFLTAAEWKERGYIINDDVRAKNLPIWREWFMENMVKK